MALTDNEYSTPKITPSADVKIPSVGGVSGYQTDGELRDFINVGVTGVTEEYSSLLTYEYGKRLMNEGVEYRCIVPVESPEVFDPDKWVKVDLTELDKRVLANADAINAIKELVAITPTYKTENFQFKYKVVYKRAGWAFFSCEVRALSAYSDYRDVAEGLPRPVENFYGGLDGGIFFINSNGKLQYYIGDTSAHYFCISYPCL